MVNVYQFNHRQFYIVNDRHVNSHTNNANFYHFLYAAPLQYSNCECICFLLNAELFTNICECYQMLANVTEYLEITLKGKEQHIPFRFLYEYRITINLYKSQCCFLRRALVQIHEYSYCGNLLMVPLVTILMMMIMMMMMIR